MSKKFIVNHQDIVNTEKSLKMEWLETNGLGGYASSTILDCHTRKYHGYLVTAVPKHAGRHVLLSKVDAVVLSGENQFGLGTNKYPGVYYPTGHRYAESFEYSTHPKTIYRIGDLIIEKSLLMPDGENAVIIKYSLLEGDKNIVLQLSPYLAYRHFHHLSKENPHLQVKMFDTKKRWKIEPYGGMPPLYFTESGKLKFYPGPDWLLNFEYLKDYKRGYEYREDLFCPGVFEAKMKPGQSIYLKASLHEKDELVPQKSWEAEIKRRKKVVDATDEFSLLQSNSRHFFIKESKGCDAGVIAGFPWFGEWGRDTMIALPGLTLGTGQKSLFFDVLSSFESEISGGLIPNERGIDKESPTYNSIDACFWYFWAIQLYIQNAKKKEKDQAVKKFAKSMHDILKVYEKNKLQYGFVDEDGLLSLGTASTQLTWMDARIDGVPVTPRNGYAVEVNALWYNALCFYKELFPATFAKDFPKLQKMLPRIPEAFLKKFWLETEGYLADVIMDGVQDISVRPNQVIAAAMPYGLLDKKQLKRLLAVVDRELLTPYGLRTLSPKNPKYRGWYKGGQVERDLSYHQGTVWPWLIGPYVDLFLKVCDGKSKEIKALLTKFQPLLDSVHENGLGSIGEIREGDSPHHSRGCPAQAWSVAETIRAITNLKRTLE